MQLPRAGHFGFDAFGDDALERFIVGSLIQLGPRESGSASTSTGLAVAESALGLEDLPARRWVGWRLRDGYRGHGGK
jgi:hypothetical protein